MSDAAKKLDVLLWIFSIPLLPMIFAEFFTVLSLEAQMYFKAYYFTLWLIFSIEFVLRLTLAKDRVAHLKTNWLDVLVVLTPVFRVFKAFHFMRLPVLLLSDRVLFALGSMGLNFLYYLIFVAVIAFVGADLALFFELENPASGIRTFGDALWWSVLNLTTSGSGHELTPTTLGARLVGVFLMTLGFAIFSVFIASLVSFFMKEYARRTPDDEETLLEGLKGQMGVEEILLRLDRIEKKMEK